VLRIRILTALVILPATLAAVFLAPAWLYRLVVALLLLGGCWEYHRIAALPRSAGWLLLAVQTAVLAALYLSWPLAADWWRWLLVLGCVAWLALLTRLSGFRENAPPTAAYRRGGTFAALVSVSFCAFALYWLRDQPRGDVLVFLLFLLIWAADVGAYFAGRFLGRHKLAPVISPRKTWEGVWGGAVLAIAAAYLLADVIAGMHLRALTLVVISVVTSFASVGGDLLISLHKRTVGLKDTGRLFPGHGGILDRYDSLLAGAPFFALSYGLLSP